MFHTKYTILVTCDYILSLFQAGNTSFLSYPDDADDSRDSNWRYRWIKDPDQEDLRAFGIEIKNVEPGDHGQWGVSVDLEKVQDPATYDFFVTVAKIPQSLELGKNHILFGARQNIRNIFYL